MARRYLLNFPNTWLKFHPNAPTEVIINRCKSQLSAFKWCLQTKFVAFIWNCSVFFYFSPINSHSIICIINPNSHSPTPTPCTTTFVLIMIFLQAFYIEFNFSSCMYAYIFPFLCLLSLRFKTSLQTNCILIWCVVRFKSPGSAARNIYIFPYLAC